MKSDFLLRGGVISGFSVCILTGIAGIFMVNGLNRGGLFLGGLLLILFY